MKQGLVGEYRFIGKPGALDYVRQAGCIQFDPVDVCGKLAELTLASRVKGFTKKQLDELLYKDRLLFDYPDKQLAIIPIECRPYFERYRASARAGGERFEGLKELEARALEFIAANGAVSAEELPLSGKLHWHSNIHWSGNWHGESNAARSVCEQLYSTGELVIHHKKGARKYYDLASRHVPRELLEAGEPLPDEHEHMKWRVARRVGAAGLVWDRPSGYWLNIWGLTAEARRRIFAELTEEGTLTRLSVEGTRYAFYMLSSDAPLLERALSSEKLRPRCEFIAPLDPLMWDKALVKAIFGFEYAWEIYTPAAKRRYGAYVLPILYGERFIGRIEAVNDRGRSTLTVKHIWYEDGVKQTKAMQAAIERSVARLARLNGCDKIN